ncbi:MAG: outer membrane beta-barrel protein [Pseudomonadota bacterium]
MRNLRLFLISSIAITFPLNAAIADDVYFGVRIGGLSPVDSNHDMESDSYIHEYDNSFSGGIFIGTSLGSGFRGELSLEALKFDTNRALDDDTPNILVGDAETLALMASIWRDLPNIGSATPYFGFGAGVAWTQGDYRRIDTTFGPEAFETDDISPIAMVGAGLRFPAGERLKFDLGYRFLSVMSVRNEEVASTTFDDTKQFGLGNYNAHQFSVGLSYQFGDPSEANSQQNTLSGPFYIGGYIGNAWTPDTILGLDAGAGAESIFPDSQLSYGLLLGAPIAPSLRAEFELGFVASEAERSVNPDSSEADLLYDGLFDQTFLLANLWQDFEQGPITFYTGGGLGLAFVDFDVDDYRLSAGGNTTSYDGSSTVFAGQFGFGLRFDASPNLTFDLGYRLRGAFGVGLGDGESPGRAENSRISVHSQAVQFGATYAFGKQELAQSPSTSDNNAYISLALGYGFNVVGETYDQPPRPYDFDRVTSISLAYGQQLTKGVRAEIEFIATNLNGDEVPQNAANQPTASLDGNVRQFSLMTNYWADFEIGKLQPYVGGGIGMALVNTDLEYDSDISSPNRTLTYSSNYSPALALQAGFGLRTPIRDDLLIDIGYRYRAVLDAFSQGDEVFETEPADNEAISTNYETHTVQVGLVWQFGN